MSYILLSLGSEPVEHDPGTDQAAALDRFIAFGNDLSGGGAEIVREWQAPDSFVSTPAYLVLRNPPHVATSSGGDALPCRRSWVRIPSSALGKAPLRRGFCCSSLGKDTAPSPRRIRA